MEWIILAKDLLPPAQPKPIPGADKVVTPLFEYGLWILAISGGAGVGIGGYKLATIIHGELSRMCAILTHAARPDGAAWTSV